MATKRKWLLMDTTMKASRVKSINDVTILQTCDVDIKEDNPVSFTRQSFLSSNTTNKAGLIDFLSVVKLRQNNIRDKSWRWQHYRKKNSRDVKVNYHGNCGKRHRHRSDVSAPLGRENALRCFTSCKKDDKAWTKRFFKEQYFERTSFYSYTRSVVVTQHHQSFKREKSICWVCTANQST